jgi:hypothetical protein
MTLFIRLIICLFQLIFSDRTVFFSHNKLANSVFQPAYQYSVLIQHCLVGVEFSQLDFHVLGMHFNRKDEIPYNVCNRNVLTTKIKKCMVLMFAA